MRRSITAFALGLGLTLAVPGWIATAQAAPAAKGKSNKKDSDKAKKDSASKKADKKNDPGFAL
jgi:hypothetical protein